MSNLDARSRRPLYLSISLFPTQRKRTSTYLCLGAVVRKTRQVLQAREAYPSAEGLLEPSSLHGCPVTPSRRKTAPPRPSRDDTVYCRCWPRRAQKVDETLLLDLPPTARFAMWRKMSVRFRVHQRFHLFCVCEKLKNLHQRVESSSCRKRIDLPAAQAGRGRVP